MNAPLPLTKADVHPVNAGKWSHWSASQAETFTQCPRKWWLNKIAGISEPERDNLKLGTQIHAEIERYYEGGPYPTYESARLLMLDPAVPKPGAGLLIEYPGDYHSGMTAAGIPCKLRIDLMDGRADDHLPIWDWKSTSDTKYCKTPDELSRNIQMTTYGEYAFRTFRPKTVSFNHGYARTKGGPKAKVVSTGPLSRAHVASMYSKLECTVAEMDAASRATDIEAVPVEREHCNAYGGCPYRNICWGAATPVTLTSLFGPNTLSSSTPAPGALPMSIKDKLAARKGAVTTPATSNGALTTPAATQATGINPPDAAVAAAPPAIGANDTIAPAVTTPWFNLYINCVPVRGAAYYINLDVLIAEHAAPICRAHKVTDVREVDFGKGTAELVASFIKTPPTGDVVATSGGLSGLVLEVLRPLATAVWQGVA